MLLVDFFSIFNNPCLKSNSSKCIYSSDLCDLCFLCPDLNLMDINSNRAIGSHGMQTVATEYEHAHVMNTAVQWAVLELPQIINTHVVVSMNI